MKTVIAMFFAFAMVLAPVKKAEATLFTTAVVAGVVVAQYAGTLAGVAVSSVLAGSTVLIGGAGKEAAVKAAQNDIENFYATGVLSLPLENSIISIQEMDASVSDAEALDMIIEAIQE